ncbi:hypothetical protein ABEB36_000458 [Hypothenemus hampei]|uniref:Uncharacterized protein n=1 Tax=Hypothenemus hampei TaxID=57062 RepID=A0ABD1FBA8_HYPHA
MVFQSPLFHLFFPLDKGAFYKEVQLLTRLVPALIPEGREPEVGISNLTKTILLPTKQC